MEICSSCKDSHVQLYYSLQINVDKSNVFSPYVSKLCEADAKNSTYGRIADLKVISRSKFCFLLSRGAHAALGVQRTLFHLDVGRVPPGRLNQMLFWLSYAPTSEAPGSFKAKKC